MWCCTTTSREM
uniref:Uncharacterized protein n=1 Tax=Arundo donax TaxID=35708 RepID=A0A0A9G237_ARUDO